MQRPATHRVALFLSAFSASLLLACGPSTPKKSGSGSDEPTLVDIDAQAAESPEQKFERQRLDTTDKMCERLIDCSMDDAKKTMTPEELEQLERENVAEMATKDCSKQYANMALSPRQVIGIRECLSAASECAEFNDCLVKATTPSEE